MSYYVNEGPDVVLLRQAWYVARNDYVCHFCHRPILKGTRYTALAYTEDSVFKYIKSHTSNGECIDDDIGLEDTDECAECLYKSSNLWAW